MSELRVVGSSGARDLAGVLADDAELRKDVDLIEVRFDRFPDPKNVDLETLASSLSRPSIFTLRPTQECGEYAGLLDDRIAIHLRADAAGFTWLDLEADVAAPVPRGRAKRLISWHGVATDSPIADCIRALAALDPDALKVAANVTCPQAALAFVREACAAGREVGLPTTAIAMGDSGAWLRPLAGKFGMPFLYAAIHESKKTAAGQFSVAAALDRYRVRQVRATTRVFAVAGSDVRRSLSPRVHNAVFARHAIDAIYVDISAAEFAPIAAIARELPLAGLSITSPFKSDAREFASAVDDPSQRIGVTNTLLRRADGTFAGTNTDVDGFRSAVELAIRRPEFVRALTVGKLKHETNPYTELRFDPPLPFGRRIERALVYGTGGAARAVAKALHDHGAKVWVTGRDLAAAMALVIALGGGIEAVSEGRATSLSFDLIVKAVPDLPNDELPIDLFEFAPGGFAADVVYQPMDTAFLRAARAVGRTPIPGTLMFAAQAALQANAFTGLSIHEILRIVSEAVSSTSLR